VIGENGSTSNGLRSFRATIPASGIQKAKIPKLIWNGTRRSAKTNLDHNLATSSFIIIARISQKHSCFSVIISRTARAVPFSVSTRKRYAYSLTSASSNSTALFLLQHRVLICTECRYAIQPSAISHYLKELHRIYRTNRQEFINHARTSRQSLT
jgi:hypothetical protein